MDVLQTETFRKVTRTKLWEGGTAIIEVPPDPALAIAFLRRQRDGLRFLNYFRIGNEVAGGIVYAHVHKGNVRLKLYRGKKLVARLEVWEKTDAAEAKSIYLDFRKPKILEGNCKDVRPTHYGFIAFDITQIPGELAAGSQVFATPAPLRGAIVIVPVS